MKDTEGFIVEAHYPRWAGLSVKAMSNPEPYEDFKILRSCYEKHCQLTPGDIVIDGGAYIGMFTCYAAKAVGPKGFVYAFEPIPKNISALDKNVMLNNELCNITSYEMALWSEETELLLEDRGPESTALHFTNTNNILVKVKTTTIDKFVTKMKLPKVNFIKLDVEGAELEVLHGAEKTLRENNIHLAIATYHHYEGIPTYIEVERYLKSLGFKVITECPEHLTTFAWKE